MEIDGYEDRLQAQADYRNGARRAWDNIRADANDVAGATDDMLTTGFNTARDALTEFAMTGKASFKDFATSVIADMARIASQQAASSLLSGLIGFGASAATSYFGGGSSSLGATQAGYGPEYMNNWPGVTQAKGGAWNSGVQLFAKGAGFAANTILNTPTMFGMGNGGLGIAGEAGPEAIMPLARGPDGSLGVQMVGGSPGSGTAVKVEAPMYFTMEDRSSEGLQLDSAALQQNLQQQMQATAERAIAASWRPGGTSYRNSNGRG